MKDLTVSSTQNYQNYKYIRESAKIRDLGYVKHMPAEVNCD